MRHFHRSSLSAPNVFDFPPYRIEQKRNISDTIPSESPMPFPFIRTKSLERTSFRKNSESSANSTTSKLRGGSWASKYSETSFSRRASSSRAYSANLPMVFEKPGFIASISGMRSARMRFLEKERSALLESVRYGWLFDARKATISDFRTERRGRKSPRESILGIPESPASFEPRTKWDKTVSA